MKWNSVMALTLSMLLGSIQAIGQGTDEPVFNFAVVESKPIYPGCEDLETEEERFNCFNQNMLEHIKKHFIYPEMDYDVSGTIYLNFIIEKDGTIGEVNVARGVDKLMDSVAVATIQKLPTMTPAYQRGVPVRMQYTVPIKVVVEASKDTGKVSNSKKLFRIFQGLGVLLAIALALIDY